MKKPVQFSVRHFSSVVHVFIWPTKADVKKAFRRIGGKGNVEAFCHSYDRYYKSGRIAPDFAEVHFNVNWLGTFVLTHEFTHAGLALMRRRKWMRHIEASENDGNVTIYEEFLCDAVAHFTMQTVNKLYALKILTTH